MTLIEMVIYPLQVNNVYSYLNYLIELFSKMFIDVGKVMRSVGLYPSGDILLIKSIIL